MLGRLATARPSRAGVFSHTPGAAALNPHVLVERSHSSSMWRSRPAIEYRARVHLSSCGWNRRNVSLENIHASPDSGHRQTSWQSVSAVPGGFFAVSQRSMTDPMGRVYYADLGP